MLRLWPPPPISNPRAAATDIERYNSLPHDGHRKQTTRTATVIKFGHDYVAIVTRGHPYYTVGRSPTYILFKFKKKWKNDTTHCVTPFDSRPDPATALPSQTVDVYVATEKRCNCVMSCEKINRFDNCVRTSVPPGGRRRTRRRGTKGRRHLPG